VAGVPGAAYRMFRALGLTPYTLSPQFTIHGVPNRSITMPNRSAQKVSAIGMVTIPPSES
jgi:hypothetical protein